MALRTRSQTRGRSRAASSRRLREQPDDLELHTGVVLPQLRHELGAPLRRRQSGMEPQMRQAAPRRQELPPLHVRRLHLDRMGAHYRDRLGAANPNAAKYMSTSPTTTAAPATASGRCVTAAPTVTTPRTNLDISGLLSIDTKHRTTVGGRCQPPPLRPTPGRSPRHSRTLHRRAATCPTRRAHPNTCPRSDPSGRAPSAARCPTG